MALIMLKQAEPAQEIPVPSHVSGFSWDRWYSENKTRLSVKRAKRYRDDPSYREKALQRGRDQRQKKKTEPVTDGYTISFSDMAHNLGITVWVLREWRRKDYFPEPQHREGRLWFKPEHQELLAKLLYFFESHGIRVVASKRKLLADVTALIYSNW